MQNRRRQTTVSPCLDLPAHHHHHHCNRQPPAVLNQPPSSRRLATCRHATAIVLVDRGTGVLQHRRRAAAAIAAGTMARTMAIVGSSTGTGTAATLGRLGHRGWVQRQNRLPPRRPRVRDSSPTGLCAQPDQKSKRRRVLGDANSTGTKRQKSQPNATADTHQQQGLTSMRVRHSGRHASVSGGRRPLAMRITNSRSVVIPSAAKSYIAILAEHERKEEVEEVKGEKRGGGGVGRTPKLGCKIKTNDPSAYW